MNNCPDCATAMTRLHHIYRADCIECAARKLAEYSIEYQESARRMVITTPYRQELAEMNHPQGFLAAHRAVKSWAEIIAGHKEAAK